MKYLLKIQFFLIFISMLYSCTPPGGFENMREHPMMFSRNRFSIDPIVFLDKDSLKPRLDLYLSIPAENILYKKESANGNYTSKIKITISINNPDSTQVIRQVHDISSVYTEEEMKKVSKEPVFLVYNYFIQPGKYILDVKITDGNVKKDYDKSLPFVIRDLNSPAYSVSDLMMLSDFKINDDGTKEITPLVTNNISGLKDVFVFFEIYTGGDTGVTKEFTFKLKNNKNENLKEESFSYLLSSPFNRIQQKVLSVDDIRKHRPGQSELEDFNPEDKDFGMIKLELWDKSENKMLTSKKLSLIPEGRQHRMMTPGRRPGM